MSIDFIHKERKRNVIKESKREKSRTEKQRKKQDGKTQHGQKNGIDTKRPKITGGKAGFNREPLSHR